MLNNKKKMFGELKGKQPYTVLEAKVNSCGVDRNLYFAVFKENQILGNFPFFYSYSNEQKGINPLYNGGLYEQIISSFVFDLLLRLPKDFTFLDIGANVGYYSVMCAGRRRDSTILSFEPHPVIYKILEMNSKLYKNIKPYMCGISSKESKETLFCDNRNIEGHSFVAKYGDNKGFQEDIGMYKVECAMHTLGFFGVDWEKVSLMKIDVQGMEMEILKNIWEDIKDGTYVIIEADDGLEEFLLNKKVEILCRHIQNYIFRK